jgi:hypothetical protein
LPKGKQPTRAEQERQAATRKVKDALTQLFHARARPAATKLREIVSSFAEELKGRPEPFPTCGMFTDLYVVREFERAEIKLRRALEGILWDWKEIQKPESEGLRRRIYEMDVEKQTAHDLGLEFYLYYSDYQILHLMAERLALILGIDPENNDRFAEWRKLDEGLTSRLRDVLAYPELASFRDDFEERIKRA